MSNCLAKIPHSCGSSDGLQLYQNNDDSITGYCWVCSKYESNPLGDKTLDDIPMKKRIKKTEEEIKADMAEISQLTCIDLPKRKLREKYLSRYNIKIGYSQEDGKTPKLAFFPYTNNGEVVRYKVKPLDGGKPWSIGLSNDVDLFGWEEAIKTGAKRLIITEGEFDAPAMQSILDRFTKDEYRDFIPAVVSIPNGAAAAKRDISRVVAKIRRNFKEVILAFDNDKAGQNAVNEVCKVLPEAKSIILPCKDANDCILEGYAKQAHKLITFNAEKPKNSRLIWGSQLHESARSAPEWGLSWPWDKMTQMTRGIRFGETIYLGAGEKMGKSEMVNAIGAHLIKEHKLKIFMAKPEEANNKSYKMLASKMVGKIFHDPKIEFDYDAYDRAGEMIGNNVAFLNLYQNINWEHLKSDMYSAAGEGVKAVFIDPITNLTNGLHTTEINEKLQGISQELATIAMDLQVVIFIFCHLNKVPKGSLTWDRGAKITTDFFAGSSAMARSCNYALGLEGNKSPELSKEEQNMRKLVLLADREFGESGFVDMYWDSKTSLFNEV